MWTEHRDVRLPDLLWSISFRWTWATTEFSVLWWAGWITSIIDESCRILSRQPGSCSRGVEKHHLSHVNFSCFHNELTSRLCRLQKLLAVLIMIAIWNTLYCMSCFQMQAILNLKQNWKRINEDLYKPPYVCSRHLSEAWNFSALSNPR